MQTTLYTLIVLVILFSCKKDPNYPPEPPVEPLPEFNKIYGGSSNDIGYSVIPTTDGGYLLAGETESRDHGMNGYHGDGDAWVVKLDKSGSMQWQRLLGGSGYDFASCVVADKDGNYIIAGGAISFDGDLSGNNNNIGAWVVKLNGTGNIVWQKVLGESGFDFANSVTVAKDGSYLITGFTSVLDEDVDAWVVKLDPNGSPAWQKIFGGLADDRAYSIAESSDGGYVMAGTSESTDGEFTGNKGDSDAWILKLDGTGTKQWQKTFGGSGYDACHHVCATGDKGYVLAGVTGSNDGDISGNNGSSDGWIIKLDQTGTLKWQKTLGGSAYDNANALAETPDHKIMIAGYTNSNDGDIETNHGKSDAWLVKLDSDGTRLWQKTYGGSGYDLFHSVLVRKDKSIVVAGATDSKDGDVSVNYGGSDGWIFTIPDK